MLKIVVMKVSAPSSELPPAQIQRKQCAIHADTRFVGSIGQRRIERPAGSGLAQRKASQDQAERGWREPEADVVEPRNAISGAPIIGGTNQFPKPPINAGMTVKKIGAVHGT
jgi:hypothetical protein